MAHDGPVYERPYDRPGWQDESAGRERFDTCRGQTTGPELRDTLLRMLSSPNLAAKSWVTDQYDRYVRATLS